MIKRYILVGSGADDFSYIYEPKPNDIFVAVDGGLKVLQEKNLDVSYFFGDNDSYSKSLKGVCVVKTYSQEKDKSDMELALESVCDFSCDCDKEILIYNATGNRLDHFIANVRLLEKFKNYSVKIIDRKNMIYMVCEKKVIFKSQYKYISFFNISNNCTISLTGFKYNLNGYQMKVNDNLCLSNEIIEEGVVTTDYPLLVIESND